MGKPLRYRDGWEMNRKKESGLRLLFASAARRGWLTGEAASRLAAAKRFIPAKAGIRGSKSKEGIA